MTESEAIEKLRAYHKCQRLQVKGIYEDCNEKLCDNCDLCYAQGNAGEHIKSIEIAIQALEEVQKYREIGRPEECREAVEKHISKKIMHQGCFDNKGVWHTWNGINGVPYDLCPNCEKNLCTDGLFGRDKKIMKYCENCGQKLDWSDEE